MLLFFAILLGIRHPCPILSPFGVSASDRVRLVLAGRGQRASDRPSCQVPWRTSTWASTTWRWRTTIELCAWSTPRWPSTTVPWWRRAEASMNQPFGLQGVVDKGRRWWWQVVAPNSLARCLGLQFFGPPIFGRATVTHMLSARTPFGLQTKLAWSPPKRQNRTMQTKGPGGDVRFQGCQGLWEGHRAGSQCRNCIPWQGFSQAPWNKGAILANSSMLLMHAVQQQPPRGRGIQWTNKPTTRPIDLHNMRKPWTPAPSAPSPVLPPLHLSKVSPSPKKAPHAIPPPSGSNWASTRTPSTTTTGRSNWTPRPPAPSTTGPPPNSAWVLLDGRVAVSGLGLGKPRCNLVQRVLEGSCSILFHTLSQRNCADGSGNILRLGSLLAWVSRSSWDEIPASAQWSCIKLKRLL